MQGTLELKLCNFKNFLLVRKTPHFEELAIIQNSHIQNYLNYITE